MLPRKLFFLSVWVEKEGGKVLVIEESFLYGKMERRKFFIFLSTEKMNYFERRRGGGGGAGISCSQGKI